MPSQERYPNPPVIERALSVRFTIPEEQFQERLPEWEEVVSQDFPFAKRRTEWELALSNVQGLPMIEREKSSMRIRRQYWSANPDALDVHPDWVIQLLADRFLLNLRRTPGDGDTQGFQALRASFDNWFQKWTACFAPTSIDGVALEYWNILRKDTVPDHATDDSVAAADLLTAFAPFAPAPGVTGFVEPSSTAHHWKVQREKREYTVFSKVNAKRIGAFALLLHIGVEQAFHGTNALPGDCLDNLHRLEREVFEMSITDTAREAFLRMEGTS
jgi:uncharacterized protein (TIGR04255 family)